MQNVGNVSYEMSALNETCIRFCVQTKHGLKLTIKSAVSIALSLLLVTIYRLHANVLRRNLEAEV